MEALVESSRLSLLGVVDECFYLSGVSDQRKTPWNLVGQRHAQTLTDLERAPSFCTPRCLFVYFHYLLHYPHEPHYSRRIGTPSSVPNVLIGGLGRLRGAIKVAAGVPNRVRVILRSVRRQLPAPWGCLCLLRRAPSVNFQDGHVERTHPVAFGLAPSARVEGPGNYQVR
jgi:hypothetical protein